MSLNVLVTGAAGYLGSSLTMTLVKRGYNVIALDNLMHNQINFPSLPLDLLEGSGAGNYLFVKADCNNWEEIKEYVFAADTLFPLHCLVGEPICKKYLKLAKKTNYKSIREIVDNLGKDQRILFNCTNSMYGANPDICTEESPVNCLSLYAKTKYDAEQYILNNHENSVVFRLATVFGKSYRDRFDLIVNNWIYRAYYERKISVYEPHFRRNYLAVLDYVLAALWAIENGGKTQLYNLGNDKENRTKLELAELLNEYIPFNLKIGKGKDPDARNYVVSSEKLAKAGFKARTPIRIGIEQFLEYFKYLPKNNKAREELLKYSRNY